MILGKLLNRAPAELEQFLRVVAGRQRSERIRVLQALLIGGLVWVATRNVLVAVWLAGVIATGFAESWAGRRAQAHATPLTWRARVTALQALSSTVFSLIAAVLLVATPTPVRLGEAAFALCAVALNNAVMASGSRLGALALTGPPAVLLALAPLWVGFVGDALSLSDTLLMAVGGAAYSVFIVQLSSAMAAERDAVASAAREAEASHDRWKMVFHNMPMARICFDATAIHARLGAALADGHVSHGMALLAAYEDGVALSKDTRILEANAEARALLPRYGGSSTFGRDYLRAFALALDSMDADGILPAFDAPLLFDDGRTRIIRIHYRLTSGQGAPWSLCLGAFEDVTEARRAAQAQEQARHAAEEANRAKSDFLAVMSHEIRTPLNGVLGMAQAMDMDELTAAQRQRLGVIRSSGGALLELLDDLLDISRLEAGRLTLETDDFDLRALIEGAHATFAAKAAAKELEFVLEIDPAIDGLWRGDPHRIRQIVTNLVDNGLKFTHLGEVSVRMTPSAAGIRIEIADTGIGISPDRVPKLFDKFVQADASATRAYGGTGLGLAICRELVQAMGGAITVTSAPGQGSTFALELPLRRTQRAEPAEPMGLPAGLSTGALRVLAAEDNEINRIVLKTLMAQFDLEPMLVENGEEAVRAWEASHWDVILMDVQMPVMDGPTATMTIRAREAVLGRPRTPILAVTANTMPHQVASYRAAGMDDVVPKPLNVTELFAALVAAIEAEDAPQVRAAS